MPDLTSLRLIGVFRALLAPGFGVAIALSFAIAWVFLGRAFTPRVLTASVYFAVAGSLSAALALLADRILMGKSRGARLSIVLLCLIVGTGGLASVFMMLDVVLTFHDLPEIPIRITLIIMAISGAGALYNVLSIALPLMLPLGLPVIALFAMLIARGAR